LGVERVVNAASPRNAAELRNVPMARNAASPRKMPAACKVAGATQKKHYFMIVLKTPKAVLF
jgi:hypothetical protein